MWLVQKKEIANLTSMNTIKQTRGCFCINLVIKLPAVLALMLSMQLQAQSLLSTNDFFDPDFTARRPGASGSVTLGINTTLFTPTAQTEGDVTWSHSAGGLVQTRVLGLVDIQLAAYTQTNGNSLIFGRELETNLLGLDLGGVVSGLVTDVVGASAINSWSSTATVANLNLSQGVLYSASFDVQAGAGINLSALSSANFTLLNGGSPIQNINSELTLDLLDLLNLGSGATDFEFQFYAPAGLDDLGFRFDAATIADVELLGGITGNDPQVVMEISNFSVTPVPEPGSVVLTALGFLILLRSRRPCRV